MNCAVKTRNQGIIQILLSAVIAVLPLINYVRGFFTTSLALDLVIFSAPFIVFLLSFRNSHMAVPVPPPASYPGRDGEGISETVSGTGHIPYRQPDTGRLILPKPAIPALMLVLYTLIRSNGSYASVMVFALVAIYLIATVSRFFDIRMIFKIIIFVSCVASVLVIVQTISYYLFGKYLQMVWLDICRYDIIKGFAAEIINGKSVGSSLFRPSAFFLEPSHFAGYVAIGLTDLLFSAKPVKNRFGKVILISLGLICSTSGMGVMVLIGEFVLYAVLHMKNKPIGTNILRIIICCVLALGIFAALMQINMFHLSMQRIFGKVDGYNAIAGRTGAWHVYINNMTGTELLFGRGTAGRSELNPIFHITGMVFLIYTLGIIGAILFAVMIALGMVKSNTRSFCLGGYYLLLSFFSETYVGVGLIFNIIVIYSGRLRAKYEVDSRSDHQICLLNEMRRTNEKTCLIPPGN